jgi:hypothetical protein
MFEASTDVPPPRAPSWVSAISVPTAIVGALAFFLPWVQMSCVIVPVHVNLTGYEIASGTWTRKVDTDRIKAFWDKADVDSRPKNQKNARPTTKPPAEAPKIPAEPRRGATTPMLWVVPVACAALALLGFFGLPRAPSIIVAVLGAAYLAYFAITSDRDLTDPQNTGGVMTHSWQWGFWLSWIGLIVPGVLAQIANGLPERGARRADDELP